MRKLVAALACRNGGSRLFGKPLQNLAPGTTILDQILAMMAALPEISTPVLGISEGIENDVFAHIAAERSIPYIVGDQRDVLARLIQCGHAAEATDVFRITTECPFLYFQPLSQAWQRHVERGNDVTVTDRLPEGTALEIYTLESLERSHRKGTEEHRSEMCSYYARQHPEEFRIDILVGPDETQRQDLRLTVDYPEDLVLCRDVYQALAARAPLISLSDIITYLEGRPDLTSLVAPYVSADTWPWQASEGARRGE